MTSQKINLNMIPQGVNPIIHVSQYDKGQTWFFYLYEGDVPYNVPVGAVVTIQGTKKDGTGFQYPCTFDGNEVTATETDQMTLFYEKYPCELSITYNGDIIGSLNFYIEVEPAPLGDDTVISDTDLPLLQQAIQAVPTCVAGAATATAKAEEAEAWAAGTVNGTPVPSTAPQYENNAKYYAENFVGYVTDTMYNDIQTLLS